MAMTDEPAEKLYTLEQARREFARRHCVEYEMHSYDVVTDPAISSPRMGKPVELRCIMCETTWKIGDGSTELQQINDALVEYGYYSPLGLRGVVDLIGSAVHGDDLEKAMRTLLDEPHPDGLPDGAWLILDRIKDALDE